MLVDFCKTIISVQNLHLKIMSKCFLSSVSNNRLKHLRIILIFMWWCSACNSYKPGAHWFAHFQTLVSQQNIQSSCSIYWSGSSRSTKGMEEMGMAVCMIACLMQKCNQWRWAFFKISSITFSSFIDIFLVCVSRVCSVCACVCVSRVCPVCGMCVCVHALVCVCPVCVRCVCMCVLVCMEKLENHWWESVFCSPISGSQGLNLGLQTWQKAPFLLSHVTHLRVHNLNNKTGRMSSV